MEIIIGKFAMIISHLCEVLKAVNQLKEPGPQFHKMRECICLFKLKMRLADCKCTVCSQELWKHKTQGLRVKVSQVPSYTSDDRGQLPHHEDSFVRFLFRNLPQISTTVLINRFNKYFVGVPWTGLEHPEEVNGGFYHHKIHRQSLQRKIFEKKLGWLFSYKINVIYKKLNR